MAASGSVPPGQRYCIEFRKTGAARFLSHLDLQAGMERALRRARLPLNYTQGFHPRPRLQFEEALPLGWTSEKERLWIELQSVYPNHEAHQRLRSVAPNGIEILRVFPHPRRPQPARTRHYRVLGMSLPDDAQQRLRSAKDRGKESSLSEQVRWRADGEAVIFELEAGTDHQPPSLKKVLRCLLGEPLPESMGVHRLSVEEGRKD